MKSLLAICLLAGYLLASVDCAAQTSQANAAVRTPVTQIHLREIRGLLQRHQLPNAQVTLDRHGRVALSGEYANREEVEIAHSIVQSVVGVTWTSFVTPENIRVTNLQKASQSALQDLFAAAAAANKAQSAPVQSAPALPDAAPGPIRKRYALVVGVGQFAFGLQPLRYAGSDARTVANYLNTAKYTPFRPQDITLLVDAAATSAAVQSWMDRIEREAEPDDFVFVFVSTHGSTPDSEGLMSVVTHDTEYDPPTGVRLRTTSVTGARLTTFVRNVRAKRMLIVLDTCFSAAAFAGLPGYRPRDAVALGIENEVFAVSDEAAGKLIGSKDLVRDDEPAMVSRPAAPDKRKMADAWGRVIMTASGPSQKSWESDQLQASFFTHYFVRGMQASGNIRDAYRYARQIVPGEVFLWKQGAVQTPMIYASRREWAYAF